MGIMQNEKTVYEDFKYCIQEISTVYIGAKYTLREIIDSDDIPFKFRMLVNRDILPQSDLEDSLETLFYYIPEDSFLINIFEHIKLKVKVSVIEERGLGRFKRSKYVQKYISSKELAKISVEDKKKMGLVVCEISINKLALAVTV